MTNEEMALDSMSMLINGFAILEDKDAETIGVVVSAFDVIFPEPKDEENKALLAAIKAWLEAKHAKAIIAESIEVESD